LILTARNAARHSWTHQEVPLSVAPLSLSATGN